jgi:hypothetical protein
VTERAPFSRGKSLALRVGALLVAYSAASALLGCGARNSDAAEAPIDHYPLPDANLVENPVALPDASSDRFDSDAADAFKGATSEVDPSRLARGFIGIEQLYEDQPEGPMLIAGQLFVTEMPCAQDQLCRWVTQPNDCGGVTTFGDGYIGDRSFGGIIPFYPGQLAKPASAGQVTLAGQTGQPVLVPDNMAITPGGVMPLRDPIIKFQPMENVHVAASGDFVPAFAADLQVPSRVTFTAPDLNRPIPSKESPFEIRWTPNGSVGMVETWSVCMFAPDLHITVGIVQCAAPVSAGRLVVPPPSCAPPPTGPAGPMGITLRVVNTIHRQVGAWDVQLSAASFDSFLLFAETPKDAGAQTSD